MARWQKGYELAGRFVIEGWLASGGMAEVYVAEMTLARGMKRRVALKRIHVHLAEDLNATTMFLDEARLVAQLVHPGVTPVHDVIEHEGELIIVLDYVPGWDLSAVIKTAQEKASPWPIDLALFIGQSLLHTLAYVHDASDVNGRKLDLVHRDVNPSNILLAEDGSVRLLDFGVAKATARFTKTLSRAIKGKLAYLAPEQAAGEAVDPRTDIYAVGLVLFELITGQRALDTRGDLELFERLRMPEIPPISMLRAEASSDIEQFVANLLQIDPANRPQTAAIAAAELESIRGATTPETLARFVEQLMGSKRREPKGARSALEQALLREAGVVVANATKNVAPPDPATIKEEPPKPARSSGIWIAAPAAAISIAVAVIALQPEKPVPIVLVTDEKIETATIAQVIVPEPPITTSSTPAATKTPPAPEIRYGSLDVSAMPWARVIIDGKTVAESTPALGLRVSEGEHTVRLVNPRLKKTVTRKVKIAAGKREKLIVDLR